MRSQSFHSVRDLIVKTFKIRKSKVSVLDVYREHPSISIDVMSLAKLDSWGAMKDDPRGTIVPIVLRVSGSSWGRSIPEDLDVHGLGFLVSLCNGRIDGLDESRTCDEIGAHVDFNDLLRLIRRNQESNPIPTSWAVSLVLGLVQFLSSRTNVVEILLLKMRRVNILVEDSEVENPAMEIGNVVPPTSAPRPVDLIRIRRPYPREKSVRPW